MATASLPRPFVAVFALAISGCGSEDRATPAPASAARLYTGEVPGTDARVGVIASESRARFYFCGGATTYTELTRWIPSDLTAAGVARPTDAWDLDAKVEEDVASGTVTAADGVARPFQARRTAPGTLAGLYEANVPCGKAGLIVSQSSAEETPMGQGACVESGSTETAGVRQVNPILPLVRTDIGTIRVVVDGSKDEAALVAAEL